jgi:hypothetical protein
VQLGLIGVFPYSAIDMGTYETLKTTYCRSTGLDEPPVFAVLSFGALSGSIGAASVYREYFFSATAPVSLLSLPPLDFKSGTCVTRPGQLANAR